MSEYTPTTEHVRMKYQDGVSGCGCCAWPDKDDAVQFNRWLAEVIREAKREGWDEGKVAYDFFPNFSVNPYRKEQQ